MPRTTAVCSWSLQPTDPAALIAALESLGCPGVQLALSPLVSDPGTWGDAIGQMHDAGITVVSGMMAMDGEDYSSLEAIARTGGVRPDETWEANLAHAEAVAALAGAAGLDLVTFHAGFLPEEVGVEREKLIDRLRSLARMFAAHEVDLGFETGQESAATLAEVLDELAEPNVGVNFDPANMILYGMGDPVAAIERLADDILQVHIKDALPTETPGTWGSEVPAGTGAVDWPAFLAVVDALDPPVACVVEREAGDARAEDIRTALALLAST